MGGSSSQLGILARLSVLDASSSLSALPALPTPILIFSSSLCIFCIGGIESAFLSLNWVGVYLSFWLGWVGILVQMSVLDASGAFPLDSALLVLFCSSRTFLYFSALLVLFCTFLYFSLNSFV